MNTSSAFCFADMQRKEKRSLGLVPTQLPSVQNAPKCCVHLPNLPNVCPQRNPGVSVVSYLFLLERAPQLCALCTELDFSGCISTLGAQSEVTQTILWRWTGHERYIKNKDLSHQGHSKSWHKPWPKMQKLMDASVLKLFLLFPPIHRY